MHQNLMMGRCSDMIHITKTEHAGFCFGVERAIDRCNAELDNCRGAEQSSELFRKSPSVRANSVSPIYSLGPLIHNELVIADLEKKGLIVKDYDKDFFHNKKVLIRSHGIKKEIMDELVKNGNEIIDLTCPFVKRIHNIVEEDVKKGYFVLVIGDKTHPEVEGIMSYAFPYVISALNEDEAKAIIDNNKDKISAGTMVSIVSQTTFDETKNKKIVDILANLFYNIKVNDTICNATSIRQKETRDLASISDVMLIIGSKNSSNTKKLYDIAKSFCKEAYFISDINDLKNLKFDEGARVGVSAGASTPKKLIEEILNHVRTNF